MTRIVEFPDGLLQKQASQNLWLRGLSASSGRGLSGREQLVFTENRIWRCLIDMTTLSQGLRIKARQLAQRLNGRINTLRLQICNTGTLRFLGDPAAFYAAAGVSAAEIDAGGLQFSDGATFADGAGFALPDTREPLAVFDASEGASEIKLERYVGANIAPGTRFSINDFLYQVDINDGGVVTFDPPLREAVAAGSEVKVSRPTVLLRLTADDGYEPFEQFGRWVTPQSIELEEEFDRVTL